MTALLSPEALAKECHLGRSAFIRGMVESMLKTPRSEEAM